jgi:hypothetical protein
LTISKLVEKTLKANHCFAIDSHQFMNLTIRKLPEFVRSMAVHAKRVEELRVLDLVPIPSRKGSVSSRFGVYLFFAPDGQLLYVGKSGKTTRSNPKTLGGRAFVERVPSHFDLGEGRWFGTFARNVTAEVCGGDVERAWEYLPTCRLMLVSVDENCSADCQDLERLFFYSMDPLLNRFKPQSLPMDETVGEWCEKQK